MTLSDDSRITLGSEQVSAELDGEAVVLNLKDGVYFGLNPVGARVWSLLKAGPKSVAQLRQAVLDDYDVAFERCDDDLRSLLTSLDEHGLIVVSD